MSIYMMSTDRVQVIYESLRLANLGTIIFRKAVKDVEVKGKLVVK